MWLHCHWQCQTYDHKMDCHFHSILHVSFLYCWESNGKRSQKLYENSQQSSWFWTHQHYVANIYFFFDTALGISILLNIPKFFEAETSVSYEINASGENVTNTRIGISDIRIHPSYITYYTMWTRLLATGIFPLAMLAILNTKIYLALRRSRHQLRSMAIRSALPMAILGNRQSQLLFLTGILEEEVIPLVICVFPTGIHKDLW